MTNQVDNVNDLDQPRGDEIVEAIHDLRHAIVAQRYRALSGGHMEAKVLNIVGRCPGSTQSDVVAELARDKGQVARLIAALKGRGLIESRVDEADRRINRLFLSNEGRDTLTKVQAQRACVAEIAVDGLSAGEQRELLGLLGRLRANLETGD